MYEKQVGDIVQKLTSTPGILASLFKPFVDDIELIKMLAGVQIKRRTSEKPKWQGASGYKHQIDESFSTEDEKVILLVECKHWKKAVDFPTFSTFMVRLIDIATNSQNRTVLGMIVTPQGHKGRAGSREEDKQCIAKIQNQFNLMGYHVVFQILTDQVILDVKL